MLRATAYGPIVRLARRDSAIRRSAMGHFRIGAYSGTAFEGPGGDMTLAAGVVLCPGPFARKRLSLGY